MKTQSELVHKINGKEYLLIEYLVATNMGGRRLDKAIMKTKAIVQGIAEMKPEGIFSAGYIIAKILVPVNKINLFKKLTED